MPIPIAEIYRKIDTGIREFLKATNISRVVVGASGGIDSAVTAALYGRILPPSDLLLVNMPSRHNSQTTQGLAAELAANLGCLYAVAPIEESVNYTIRQIESTPISRPHSQSESPLYLKLSPLAKENIQARDRGARLLAGFAAAFGGAFTCNANKTESTAGYATFYGDNAGFLAAIGDLWKHEVYALARYLNAEIYRREAVPQGTLEITPSAELSPAQAVDEGKGDPLVYPYHDYLFRAWVEDAASPLDCLKWYASGELEEKIGCEKSLAAKLFPAPKDFIADLERWHNAYKGLAVAKRYQAPPVIPVSPRPFGFPESQGGFQYGGEYEKLKEELLCEK